MPSASPIIRFAPPPKAPIPAVQPPLEPLITREQAAKLSGLSIGTIANAIKAGDLEFMKFGASVRIAPSALRQWWASRAAKRTTDEPKT